MPKFSRSGRRPRPSAPSGWSTATSTSRWSPARCAPGAISFARIRRLYYGAADPKGGAVDSGVRFFAQPTCHHVPEVYSAVGETEAATLLKEFFKVRR